MPELPEVETVAQDLRRAVVGRRITAVCVRETRLRRAVAPDLGARLVGRSITTATRHGKFLVLALNGAGGDLVVHLGMSGTLRVVGQSEPLRAHDHVSIDLGGGRRLVLNDPRRFGLLVLQANGEGLPTRLGVDPESPAFTAEALAALARRRRRPVKNLLMDQGLVAGLGNIYSSEILFRAGIRPGRAAGRLTRRDCEAVVRATHAVLREAIRRRGSSISDFRDASGTRGGFQDRFFVYDRAGEPCRRCTTPIRRRVLAGRSSFYCPRCQR